MKFKKKYQVSKNATLGFYVTKDTDIVLDFSDGYTKNTTGVLNFTGADRSPPNPLLQGVIQLPEVIIKGTLYTEPANTVRLGGSIPVDDAPALSGELFSIRVSKVSGQIALNDNPALQGTLFSRARTRLSGSINLGDTVTVSGELLVETPTRISGDINLSDLDTTIKGQLVFTPRAKVSGSISLADEAGLTGTFDVKYLAKLSGSLDLSDGLSLQGELEHIKPTWLSGSIPVTDEVGVVGELESVFRTFLDGVVDLGDEPAITGFVKWIIPTVVVGVISLENDVAIEGSLGYKDDVFRGLRKDYAHTHAKTDQIAAFFKAVHSEGVPIRGNDLMAWGALEDHLRLTVFSGFEDGGSIRGNYGSPFEGSMPKHRLNVLSDFKDGIRVRRSSEEVFQDFAVKLRHSQGDWFRDMIRLRREMASMFQEAVNVSKFFLSRYNFGLEFRKNYKVKWNEATKILLLLKNLKPSIPPYIQPRVEDFKLEFKCAYRVRNLEDDCILYFGATRCKRPYRIKEGKLYMVENKVDITRASDGAVIEGTSGNVSTDIDSWCWTGSIAVAETHINVINEDTSPYSMIDVKVNGDTYRLLVEGYKRSRSFGKTQYTLSCRSLSALLSDDYAAPITYTNQTEVSAVQLIQEIVYNAVGDLIRVEWADLVSDIGWVLKPNAVSFANVSPIEAIKQIVGPVGGVVFSHPNKPLITIKKAYPYAHWENPLVIDHDLPIDIMENESTDWNKTTPKNAVFITDTLTGDQARVFRGGTSGNRLADEVTSTVFSSDLAMQSGGKHALTVNNPSEVTGWNFPFLPEIRYLYPCDIMRVREGESSWWGTVTGVTLNFAVSSDFIDVTYSVKTTRFMEEGLE